jgi:hypothetical protein
LAGTAGHSKKSAHALEQDRPDILKRRRDWFDGQLDLDPAKLVFIDETIRETIEAAGASLLYLPPYSPDFNPIENAFSKLKPLLRAKAERTIKALWDAVGPLLDQFTPAVCANYFRAAGYDPGLNRMCSSRLLKKVARGGGLSVIH